MYSNLLLICITVLLKDSWGGYRASSQTFIATLAIISPSILLVNRIKNAWWIGSCSRCLGKYTTTSVKHAILGPPIERIVLLIWIAVLSLNTNDTFLFFFLVERKPLGSLHYAQEAEIFHKFERWLRHFKLLHLAVCLLPAFLLAWGLSDLLKLQLARICAIFIAITRRKSIHKWCLDLSTSWQWVALNSIHNSSYFLLLIWKF